MRQGNLAGPRNATAANEAGLRAGVMRRAERALCDQRMLGAEESGNRMDLRAFQTFANGQRRHDRWQRTRQHGFTSAWRTDHDEVVAAGGSDLHGALGLVLAFDIGKIDARLRRCCQKTGDVRLGQRLGAFRAHEKIDDVLERGKGVGGDAADRRFAAISCRGDQGFAAVFHGHGQRQHAFHRTNAAVEPELADEEKAVEDFQRRLLCRSEHGDGDRQIEGRAFFFDRGRRQIDDDASWRNIKALVFHRRADALLALFDRGVRQSDDLPGRHAAAGIDLNLDGVGSKTAQGGGVDLCEHGSFLL